MKYQVLAVLLWLLIPSVSNAADFKDLPKKEYAFQAIHAIDLAQTLYASNNQDRFIEANPILGKHPNNESVIMFFATTGIAHTAVTMYLMDHHPEYVSLWENTTIYIKGATIMWNFTVILK